MRIWLGLIVAVVIGGVAEAQVSSTPAVREDPLGRSTPRSALVNFLREVQRGNFSVTPEYLEVRGRPGDPDNQTTRDLAQKLQAVLNRAADIDVNRVSDSAEGDLTDGLSSEEELLATVLTPGGQTDILLHRVTNNGIEVWLFSAKTLAAITQMSLPPFALDRYIPAVLMRPLLFNVGGWQWIGLILLVPAALNGSLFRSRRQPGTFVQAARAPVGATEKIRSEDYVTCYPS